MFSIAYKKTNKWHINCFNPGQLESIKAFAGILGKNPIANATNKSSQARV
jgi:hypothetical protein